MIFDAELVLPGSFVVLQGAPGDGLNNTMDTLPDHVEREAVAPVQEIRQLQQQQSDSEQPQGIMADSYLHVPEAAEIPTATTTEAEEAASPAVITPNLAGILASSVVPPPMRLTSASSLQRKPSLSMNEQQVEATSDDTDADVYTNTAEGTDSDHSQDCNSFVVVSDDAAAASDPSVMAVQDASRKIARRTSPDHDDTEAPDNAATLTATGDEQQSSQFRPRILAEVHSLERWFADCRQKEILHQSEWRESKVAAGIPTSQEQTWWMTDGRLAIFEYLPRRIVGSNFFPAAIGTLSPGTTVIGSQLVTLDSETFRPVDTLLASNSINKPNKSVDDASVVPRGRSGWIQFLKVESPVSGYVVLSLNGYSFLAPGLPSNFVEPENWTWRITCPVGAFVREGLDLSTKHIETIPYGSFVHVKRKTVNVMGLSRLQITGVAEQQDGTQRVVDGWCSEFLNPLSGQRGSIVQPVSFPVPALYRVNLVEGAVIRSGVELSTPQIGHAPFGAVLVVAGRAFSEHPMDRCIDRLRLAGDGGWISMRLNKHPPHDLLVAECQGIDGSFEPDNPGIFHLDSMRRVRREQENVEVSSGRVSTDLSSIDDDEGHALSASASSQELGAIAASARPSCTYTAQAKNYTGNRRVGAGGPGATTTNSDELCLVCRSEERNATIVHGETGHVACCLVCARMLKARGDPCLVCRMRIDSVIQHFWA